MMTLPTIKRLLPLALVSCLLACGSEEPVEAVEGATSAGSGSADAGAATLDADKEAACQAIPSLPFCSPSEPKPGFAKFAVGRADAVRWTGTIGCRQVDFRTGRQGDDRLTVAAGEIRATCDERPVHFEFVYRQHTQGLGKDSWTSAFRPLNADAAARLIDSCSPSTRPKPATAVESWWKANNTYAENLMLDYIAPLQYATRLLPFDDDRVEKVGEDVVEGTSTIQFRNDAATVWMMADEPRNRPVRLLRHNQTADVRFTAWDEPFAANIPGEMRSLSEICDAS